VRLLPYATHARPRTRGECARAPRPCPFVGCRHHLALDVTSSGSIRIAYPDADEGRETCSLDVADDGEHTLEEVGELLNLTRERIRQIEDTALRKIRNEWPRMRMEIGG
jgi:hypothetical protein